MLKRSRASSFSKTVLLVSGSVTLTILRENSKIFVRLSLGQDHILWKRSLGLVGEEKKAREE